MLTLFVEKRNNRLAHEESLMVQVAKDLDLPIIEATLKQVERNQIDFGQYSIVAGGVPFIKQALRYYGKELPAENSYPECLRHLMYRDVEKIPTLAEAKVLLDEGKSLFIKPTAIKRFTGFVTIDSMDYRFMGASNRTPVWVSTPVNFLSEWRVYVALDTIQKISFCSGHREYVPDVYAIQAAVKLLMANGAPAGYAIDFGVLDTGETALVEMNDGFSIGAYLDISPKQYWSVIAARWNELKRLE